jgi:hypothetical protein
MRPGHSINSAAMQSRKIEIRTMRPTNANAARVLTFRLFAAS